MICCMHFCYQLCYCAETGTQTTGVLHPAQKTPLVPAHLSKVQPTVVQLGVIIPR